MAENLDPSRVFGAIFQYPGSYGHVRDLTADIAALLEPFDLKNQLSSNRTQGVPNMIALIRETAARYIDE